MLRFLAERRGRLEADEGEDREHHPLEDAAPVTGRVRRVERLHVQLAPLREEDPDRERCEDGDLERAEQHARSGRDAHVSVGEQEDERRHDQHPHDPLAAPVPADARVEDVVHRPAELEVEERRDERLEPDEEPRGEEPGPRPERAGGVGVEAAGARQVLRELPDRGRGAEARDQREADRERQRLPRVRHGDVDRVRDGGRGGHVRDRLEQHLRQPDRVLAQMLEAYVLLPPSRPPSSGKGRFDQMFGGVCN